MKYLFIIKSRIIARHSVEKKSLEGFENNFEYIAHRLNWNKADMEKALNKHQDLLDHSPSKVCFEFHPKFLDKTTKLFYYLLALSLIGNFGTDQKQIKEHLDYLLNEVQFDVKEISKRLYIFEKSLHEMEARVDELSKIGAPITVDALNKHKAHYLKYVKNYCNEENEEHKIILLNIEIRLKSSRRKMRIKKPTN